MKKNLIIAASVLAVLAITFNSCNTTPSTKVVLGNEVDSVSYSLGASIGENLGGALQQMKIVSDTLSVRAEYSSKISAEQDEAKKTGLTKEMRHKIDSLHKANEHGTAEFLQGLQKAINSRPSQSSYNFGYSVGTQVNMQVKMMLEQFYGENSDKEGNKDAIVAAITATLLKKQPAMANASSYLMMKSQEMQQKEMEKKRALGDTNRKAGEEFLAQNKSKDGIVTLESGLQYRIITDGTGVKPLLTDRVKCHYHGTLLNGTIFDSSVQRGEPATFPVQGVIAGWTEVLQLMPVGSKWEVFIPYNLAYGENGAGEEIGAFETLKFDIELLEILGK